MDEKKQMDALLPSDSAIRARRVALEAELNRAAPSRRLRRRSARAAIALVVLVAIGTGVAWAAGVFSASEIAVDAGVGCYDRASFHGDIAIFPAAADPVAKCARVWREGGMTGGNSTAVPHLVACAAEGRPVMVFPGPDSVCERLGLSPLPSDYPAPGRAHARAYRALFILKSRNAPAPNSACPSPRGQAAFARSLLSRAHSDVPVVIESGGPCGAGYTLTGRDGDRIAVIAVSRARGRVNLEARNRRRAMGRVQAVLDPLFGRPPRFRRTREQCLDPREFAAEARGALSRAGRGDIPVRIQGDGECVSLYAKASTCCVTRGDDDAAFVVTLRTMTRRNWRWSKKQDRKWKRLREAAGTD